MLLFHYYDDTANCFIATSLESAVANKINSEYFDERQVIKKESVIFFSIIAQVIDD